MIRRPALASVPKRVLSLLILALTLSAMVAVVSGLLGVAGPAAQPIRIGAVFPSVPNAAGLADAEREGVRIAARFVNADGGVNGRPIELVERSLDARDQAPSVMADLAAQGVSVVIGAYSSDLSIAASAAASSAGLLYWEAGAVADQLTGRGLPLVFRVGTNGSTLGTNSAAFAAQQLAPRLDKSPGQLRVAIVVAEDAYATSVADAAARTASADGLNVVAQIPYNLAVPRWPDVMAALRAARPDAIILASHVPDGVAFRQAMLAANLKVGALIGSTMAECDPDFAGDLGADAIGIFASDRPTAGFRPDALDPAARATYDRFAAAWSAASGGGPAWTSVPATSAGTWSAPSSGPSEAPASWATPTSGDDGYDLIGPAESAPASATEEALSGFSAGWALFHDVLPTATPASGGLDAPQVAAAARSVDLPSGSLPNGAGLRFSSDPASLGQNERAAAVIWQWQAVKQYAFVWPPSYATGPIIDVPLTR